MRAADDPVYFVESPYFLGLKPFPKQAEILREFYKGKYKELVLVAGMRCIAEGTQIYANSHMVPVEQVTEQKILTWTGKHIEPVRCELIPQGKRQVYRLRTYSGKEIEVTANHPILTSRGWLLVSDILEMDRLPHVAMCRYVPEPENAIHDPDYAAVAGFFVAEGCWHSSPQISNKSKRLIEQFEQKLQRRFGSRLKWINRYDYRIVGGTFRVEFRDFKRKRASEKLIPERVFELDNESLKEFIRWFWLGDGGIENGRVCFYSTSKKLLQQLQFLLLRFRIRSILRKGHQYEAYRKRHPDMKSTNTSYILKVHDDISQIIPEAPARRHNYTSPMDTIGLKLRDLKEITGLSIWSLRKLMCTNVRNNISLKNARKLGGIYASEDVYFEPLVAIESAGVKMTYDISVPHQGHAFVANGIIVHNSGKTSLAAMFALYEAFKLLILPDPAKHYGLIPGSPIFVVVVAVSEEQARDTIFARILSMLRGSPFFKEFRPKIYRNEIRFPSKNIIILCGHSSSASLVGRDVKLVVFDELARFEESSSKRGAWTVYNSLKRSTATFRDEGYVISISSPLHENDIIMTLYELAQETPDMLGLRYATWEFNPYISFDDLKLELQKDPASFWTLFGATPIESVAPYISPEILNMRTDVPNYLKLIAAGLEPDIEPGEYYVAGDPALRHDSFGVALVRRDGEKFVVCGTYRFKPPIHKGKRIDINPLEVKRFIEKVVRLTKARAVVFDTWSFPELQEELRLSGVEVVNHVVRKEDYDKFKELCYTNRVVMCVDNVARREFEQLRIINNRRVDHPKGGSKDVADAIVNAIWLAQQEQKPYPWNLVTYT